MEPDKKYKGEDRRKGVRWSQIIPTNYLLINCERDTILKEMRVASIHDISAVGVCLEVSELDESLKDDLISGRAKVLLEMELPGIREPISASSKVVWLSKLWKESGKAEGGYLMGLDFIDIATSSSDIIIDFILKSYAGRFKE